MLSSSAGGTFAAFSFPIKWLTDPLLQGSGRSDNASRRGEGLD